MYNVDLKNVVPSGDLTCLFAKATIDESNLWHKRLGHINFKLRNKLVKGNQPNHNACIQEKLDEGKVGKETKSAQQYVLLPLWSTGSKDPQNTDADVAFDIKENEFAVHVSSSSSDKPKKHDKKAKREAKGKITAVRPNSTNSTNNFNAASPSDNAVYVDDIIFRSTNKELCKAFEKLMKDKFKMSLMGELTFFLGLQVKQKKDGIFISQDKYVAKILRKFGLTDAYSDSDYARASLDRKSTIGGCQFLGCRLISWQCKKQTVIVASLTEAEYVSFTSYCAYVLWIQNQLVDYGHKLMLFGLTKDGVPLMLLECLPNEEIFVELPRMGYEKAPPKLTFYKAFFSAQWKFLIHTIVQCMSAKRTAWNEFSSSMASAIICLATDDLSAYNTKYPSPALTQKVFANIRRIGKGFLGVETPLFDTMLVQPQVHDDNEDASKQGGIIILDVNNDVTLVDVDNAVEMDADTQGRMEEDVNAVKVVNATEPTIFDDEEVTMTMAQTLIKMKSKKARLLDEQMDKRIQDEELKQMQEKHLDNIKKCQSLKRKPISVAQPRKNIIVYLKNMAGYKIQYFKGMTYDQVRPIFEREYNKVQTFLKSDRDEEPTKKRPAKETLL
uniref:Uncharacterized protein n=1 Tax=Tanacetum cinerariifolium TaxID=118510 RepID=A0A6L2N4J3_TANCI|nr:hypothetical protein [Tanacetum cinerariifolium]